MTTDVHTLSGAYALDALTPEEGDEFRRHLAACPACRQEVREFRRVVARMAAAEAEAPPPDLRARVLAAAAHTPQEPPRVTASTVDRRPAGPHRRRWLAAAAAAVVLAGGAGIGLRALTGDEPALAPAAEQVFEAPDERTATVETANGGTLTVGVSPRRNEMAVDTRDLPDPGDGRVYQIWAIHGSETQSAAVLSDIGRGAAMGMPGADTEVALSVEPAGGSAQPTGDFIVRVDPRDV